MAYNNTFNMNSYFSNNYGLPKKPAPYKFGKKNILVLILFCWIWIPLYIIKKSASNGAIKEWENAYNYRRSNWLYEYDKRVKQIEASTNFKQEALDESGIDESELQPISPDDTTKCLILNGKDFSKFWREDTKGNYRTSIIFYNAVLTTADYVVLYTKTINLCDGSVKRNNQEFAYEKISSINVSTISVEPKSQSVDGKAKEEIDTEALVLNVPGDKMSLCFTPDEEGLCKKRIKQLQGYIRAKSRG